MRIATANIKRALPDDAAETALARILRRGPAFVALQEWGRARTVDYGDVYRTTGGRRPILYDRFGFELVTTHLVTLAPGRRVSRLRGRRGKLGDSIARVATFLERETAAYWTILNFHLPAAVETAGRPRLTSGPHRLGMHAEAVTTLAALWQAYDRLDHHTFACGDTNVDHRLDAKVRHDLFPASRMARVGATSCWEGNMPPRRDGTHGRRLIDQVYARAAADHVDQVSNRSDHDAVLASYL